MEKPTKRKERNNISNGNKCYTYNIVHTGIVVTMLSFCLRKQVLPVFLILLIKIRVHKLVCKKVKEKEKREQKKKRKTKHHNKMLQSEAKFVICCALSSYQWVTQKAASLLASIATTCGGHYDSQK